MPGIVSTFFPYCSGAKTCSSNAPSCTSPKVPRVLTLLSTRLSEPTSLASFCISPRPRWTCSSRSATAEALAEALLERRVQLLVDGRADLLELLLVVGLDRVQPRLDGRLDLGHALVVGAHERLQLLAQGIRELLQRRRLAETLRGLRASSDSRASRACSICAEVAWPSDSARCCCNAASCRLKLSICSFCVRAVSSAGQATCAERRRAWRRAPGACPGRCAGPRRAARAPGARCIASTGGRRSAIQKVMTTRSARSAGISQSKCIRDCRSGDARPAGAARPVERSSSARPAAARPALERGRTRPARAVRAQPPATRPPA